MAKSKSFFGLRRGSTKSLTFQVLNGRQVTKDRVYDVKNPRTFSQMQQRMVMATAAAAYAGMREIVDHSFEDITYGQPTMSEFIRLNAIMLRKGFFAGNSNLAFNPYGDRKLYRNPYIVSKGSLKNGSSVSVEDFGDSLISLLWTYSTIDANTTLAQFISNIGISVNGYITFLCVANSPSTGVTQFGYIRLTPKASELQTAVVGNVIGDLFDIESNVPVSLDNEIKADNSHYVVFDFDEGNIESVSAGIVISEKKNYWLRSSCQMSIGDEQGNPSPAATALATYPVGTDYILNGGTV